MLLTESFLLGGERIEGVPFNGILANRLQPVIVKYDQNSGCYNYFNQFGTTYNRRCWDIHQERVENIVLGAPARHKLFTHDEISFMLDLAGLKTPDVSFLLSLAADYERCSFVMTGSRFGGVISTLIDLEKMYKAWTKTYEYKEDNSNTENNYIFMLSFYQLSTIVANLKNKRFDGVGLAVEVLNKYNTCRYKVPNLSYALYAIYTNNYEDVFFRDCVPIFQQRDIFYPHTIDIVHGYHKYQVDETHIGHITYGKRDAVRMPRYAASTISLQANKKGISLSDKVIKGLGNKYDNQDSKSYEDYLSIPEGIAPPPQDLNEEYISMPVLDIESMPVMGTQKPVAFKARVQKKFSTIAKLVNTDEFTIDTDDAHALNAKYEYATAAIDTKMKTSGESDVRWWGEEDIDPTYPEATKSVKASVVMASPVIDEDCVVASDSSVKLATKKVNSHRGSAKHAMPIDYAKVEMLTAEHASEMAKCLKDKANEVQKKVLRERSNTAPIDWGSSTTTSTVSYSNYYKLS